MTKADDKREAILNRIADFILAQGLSAVTLRTVAQAAGTSDRMLLYYFPDKAAVLSGALSVLSARLKAGLEMHTSEQPLAFDPLRVRLVTMAVDPDHWPFMKVWLEIVALSARGDPFFQTVGAQLAQEYLTWIAAQLDCSDDTQRKTDAIRLFAEIEGAILLKAVGVKVPKP